MKKIEIGGYRVLIESKRERKKIAQRAAQIKSEKAQEKIKQAIKTGTLHLTKTDGTKSGRTRDIPVRSASQKQVLEKALSFVKEHNLKSLSPTEHIKEQYKYAENIKSVFNKEHNSKMDYHGERHFYAQQRIQEGASRLEVSQELGHSREEITKVYAGA